MPTIDASSGQGTTGKRRNPFLVWLDWPLITLGIYHLYWWYKINDEARRLDQSINVDRVMSLLASIPGGLIIVPAFVTEQPNGRPPPVDATCGRDDPERDPTSASHLSPQRAFPQPTGSTRHARSGHTDRTQCRT